MALTPISERNLREMARHDDAELRIKEGYRSNTKVDLDEGSWGKRLVRNLSLPFREATKGDEYTDTKKAVLASLTDIYGPELAGKVFRANIGHMSLNTHFGEHVTSRYHPITGRHIRQMMEQADRELLEKYDRPEIGGVKFGREAGDYGALAATQQWMFEKLGEDDGATGVDLRASRIEISDRPGRDPFGNVVEALFNDANLLVYRESDEPHFCWTLDVGIGEGKRHPIGLSIDPDPGRRGMVHVYDGNVRSVSVPREELAAWLRAHVHTEYASDRLELHRSRAALEGYFHRTDGVGWSRDSGRLSVDPKGVDYWLHQNFAKVLKDRVDLDGPKNLQVAKSFRSDVFRENYQVFTQGRNFVLRSENSGQVLASLVHGGTDEQDRNAVYNLSILLNQNLGQTGSDLVGTEVKRSILDRPGITVKQEDQNYCVVVPDGNDGAKDVRVSRNYHPDRIRIEFEMIQPLQLIGLPDEKYLDARESWQNMRYSIDISLDDLRSEEGYRAIRTSSLEARVKVSPMDDDNGKNVSKIAMFRHGQGFISDRAVGLEVIERTLGGSVNDEPRDLTENELQTLPKTLNAQGRDNLSRLLSQDLVTRIYGRFYRALTDQDLPVGQLGAGQTTFSTGIDREGEAVLDIQFRHPLPDGLPNTILFYGGERPYGGQIDTVVTVRIPVKELNEGIPETYDFLHAPRLEWMPIENDRDI